MHYLFLTPGALKSLVLIGSMASWQPIPFAPLYTASKHAVLGLMRSLSVNAPLRLACVHPFFVSTNIVDPIALLFLSGIPKNTVQRVAGTIFYAATNPDENTNGAAWILADDGETLMAVKEELKMGVYKMIDRRVNSVKQSVSFAQSILLELNVVLHSIATGVRTCVAILWDVSQVVGKPIVIAALGVLAAKTALGYL